MCLPISEVEKLVGGKLVNTVKLLNEFFFQDGICGQQVKRIRVFSKIKINNYIVEIEYYFIRKSQGEGITIN